MSWTLSHFRAGDLVEVRDREEILATLDERGCVDGMPFMPEMLQYCGQRFRVSAVAHKTCDTARRSGGRRLPRTVHLVGTFCDGSSHGACGAACNVFWKDAWLKPAREDGQNSAGRIDQDAPRSCSSGYSEAELFTHTRVASSDQQNEPQYSCQATMLFDATAALPWWDPRQYVLDVVTGNHSAGRVFRVLWLASLRWLRSVPFGYRLVSFFVNRMHIWLTGRMVPGVEGKIEIGQRTPVGQLDLKAGEYVRVKPQAEIEKTLDGSGKNRGLFFDPEEMGRHCGRVFRVRGRVTKIIDEVTGKMLHMKQPCILLDGVVCSAEYACRRLNCPRAIPSHWREIWLERVDTEAMLPAMEAWIPPRSNRGEDSGRDGGIDSSEDPRQAIPNTP